VIRGAAAAASDGAAATAAQAVIEAGGSAVDAVIAGFFGAAGAHPGVLFAPAVALVAGFGAGGRIFDGRAAQPGRGAPRPRGFVDDSGIPGGAYVAVPRSISMLMLLSSYLGKSSLGELAKAGVASAEAGGAKARAGLIKKVGAGGVMALRTTEISRALLAAGGTVAGGALTADDIDEAAPGEAEATATPLDTGITVYAPPFPLPPDADRGDAEAIVACDSRGLYAALSYDPARGGVAVPGFEVTLGRWAVPVRRGVTRLAPGTLLPAPAPIAIAVQSGGFAAAVGLPGRLRIDVDLAAGLVRGSAMETALADLRDKAGGRSAVAVITDGKTARSALMS
jgi:hypothetical protein